MSDDWACEQAWIHREAQDYAELTASLEVAFHADLAEAPHEVALLFFRSYDEFTRRLAQPLAAQRRIDESEVDRIAARLAQVATIARFPECEHLVSENGNWTWADEMRSFLRSSSAEARFFFSRTHHSLKDALDQQNNGR